MHHVILSYHPTTVNIIRLFSQKKREINGYLRIVPQKTRKILKKTNNVV